MAPASSRTRASATSPPAGAWDERRIADGPDLESSAGFRKVVGEIKRVRSAIRPDLKGSHSEFRRRAACQALTQAWRVPPCRMARGGTAFVCVRTKPAVVKGARRPRSDGANTADIQVADDGDEQTSRCNASKIAIPSGPQTTASPSSVNDVARSCIAVTTMAGPAAPVVAATGEQPNGITVALDLQPEPSCFISWTQSGPAEGFTARLGMQGGTKSSVVAGAQHYPQSALQVDRPAGAAARGWEDVTTIAGMLVIAAAPGGKSGPRRLPRPLVNRRQLTQRATTRNLRALSLVVNSGLSFRAIATVL
jgi:hypothetical protein